MAPTKLFLLRPGDFFEYEGEVYQRLNKQGGACIHWKTKEQFDLATMTQVIALYGPPEPEPEPVVAKKKKVEEDEYSTGELKGGDSN